MIEVYLTRAIRSFLKRVCEGYALETEKGSFTKPKIVNGYLPPDTDSSDEFPFVLVRAESATTTTHSTDVTVSIVIGVFNDEDANAVGHDIAMDVVARIRGELIRLPDQVLDGRYQVQLPITWETVPEQRYPYWQVNMSTVWRLANPISWRSE